MLRYKTNLLRHTFAIRTVLAKRGDVATIDIGTMELRAKISGKEFVLYRQFVLMRADGTMQYVHRRQGDAVLGFFGWLPYRLRMWPLGQDKLGFKEYAIQHQLHTPRWEIDPAKVDFTYLIKARRLGRLELPAKTNN